MELVKLLLLAIAGVLLGIQFRSSKQEFSIYIGMVLCMLILGAGLEKMEGILAEMELMQKMYSENQEYLNILLKVIGITYLCEFAAGICKDAGYQAVAGQIEVFGKLSVLLSGMPIILAVIQTIQEFSL
ncbi:MAG: SpoIIIAC/SpoIIIAD family protein [Lachnospiraceae bacterium]